MTKRNAGSGNGNDGPEDIDLNFRPKTYFAPRAMEKYLLSRVKGAVLKRRLRELLSEGRHAEVRELLGPNGIGAVDAKGFERVHPSFMGGNYLPDTGSDEVEIARICIASTTADVTSVYARFDDGVIRYRVVDQYGGETLTESTVVSSKEPLSLRALVDFFLGAWPLQEVLEMNFADDVDAALDFFRGESEFYREFDRLCRRRMIVHFAAMI